MVTSAQQAELHAPTQADTLAEGKTANTYTDSRYAFSSSWFWNVVEATWFPYFQQK